MARFFDDTNPDYLVYPSVRASNSELPGTFSCWFQCDADIGDGRQSLLHWLVSADNAEEGKITILSNGRIQLTHASDTVELIKETTTGQFTYGSTWYHLLVTEDGTGNHSGVKMYIDGSELTYGGTEQDHSGTRPSDDAGSWCVGGRYFDGGRPFGGQLANYGYWDFVADAGMIAGLAAGYSPLNYLGGLLFAPDLVRGTRDPVTGVASITSGTTVQVHPRTIWPSAPASYSSPPEPKTVSLCRPIVTVT